MSKFRTLPRDDVLDGAGQDVAVVGQAGGEGRAIEEGEPRLVLALLQGSLESLKENRFDLNL